MNQLRPQRPIRWKMILATYAGSAAFLAALALLFHGITT
jgi:hypothetical protein